MQLFFFSAVFGLLAFSAAGRVRGVKYRIILPKDYVGWVRVDFSIESALELNVSEDETATVIVPDNGVSQTSSTWVHDVRESYLLYYRIGDQLIEVPKSLYSSKFMLGGFSSSQRTASGSWAPCWYFLIGPESLRKKYPTKAFLPTDATPPTPGRISPD